MNMPKRPILEYVDYTSNASDIYDYWDAQAQTLYREECPFCCQPCEVIQDEFIYATAEQYDRQAICHRCGWWSFECDQAEDLSGNSYYYSSRATLKRFAVESEDVPSRALAKYLTENAERLIDVSPQKFEDLVADVYREALGYRIEFCSYCRPDRGIDVIAVARDTGEHTAIQVKRYKNPIELGQIHQFFGALVESQKRRGVFVTTSKFRRGCHDVRSNLAHLTGIQIDLVDGSRFLEFLKLLNSDNKPVHCPESEWHKYGYWVNFKRWGPK